MKIIAWYSFVLLVFTILYWIPTFLSNTGEWETGLWVIIMYTPVAYYLFLKAKTE